MKDIIADISVVWYCVKNAIEVFVSEPMILITILFIASTMFGYIKHKRP